MCGSIQSMVVHTEVHCTACSKNWSDDDVFFYQSKLHNLACASCFQISLESVAQSSLEVVVKYLADLVVFYSSASLLTNHLSHLDEISVGQENSIHLLFCILYIHSQGQFLRLCYIRYGTISNSCADTNQISLHLPYFDCTFRQLQVFQWYVYVHIHFLWF